MSFFGAKVIVFEGIDGSGKSTQIKVLSRFFDKLGIKYYCTREPGGSPMAEKIRKLFLSHEKLDIYTQIFLCCAARKEHLLYLAELQQKENFDFIIFDRFIDSTFAYQIYPNNISEHFLFNINKASQLNIEVDCEFILHVNLELIATRRRKSRDHFDENFLLEN